MKNYSKPFLNIFTLLTLLISFLSSAIIVTPAYAATFLITKTADTNDGVCDADCSLREAITAANANGAGSDTLTLPAGVYTLTLGSQLPAVSTTLIINGGGVAATIIQANAVTRTATYRIFEVSSGGDLTLNDLTVQNGQCLGACATLTASGGGILSQGTLSVTNSAVSGNATNTNGGGIYSSGTLTITNSTISGNVTNQNGAGIFSSGPMTVTKSTFSGNFVTQNGGGIYNSGDLTVTNNTFSGNSAGGRGGGIYNTTGTLTVTNSTFSGNWADIEGGGVSRVSGTVTLKNTLIANSPSGHGANCGNTLPGTLTADSKNISDDSSCASATISVTTNLGALLLNGGSTLNFALLAGSSAIDTGDNSVCPATDQRGIARFQGLACDIGAYEFQGTPTLLTVAPATGTYGGTVNLTATLTSGGSGISGRTINFTLNGSSVGSAVTNGSGVAALNNVSLLGINAGIYPAGVGSGVGAIFAGDATYNSSSGNATLTVTQAALTVTANNKTRAYGAANPAFDAALTGFVNGEVLATSDVTGVPACSSTATSASPVSGSPYAITCVINTLASSNYSFAFVNGQLTVTARTLNVTATGVNKPYDGNTTATVTLADDRIGGDVLTLTYTSASFLNPNVGTGKTVNVSGISISGGADAGNYSLGNTSTSTTADITAIAASVTPNNNSKVFGAADPLPLTTGTLVGFIPGDGVTATYARTAGETVGPYTINAALNPAGVLGNYNITYNTATFTIGQAIPAITWSNPANITYGTALSGTQLNATASVPGAFTYTPASGVILNAGNNQNLHVDFVPTDATNYTNASVNVKINVNKATLTVIADNQNIIFGDPDPAFTFTYSAFVPGDTPADLTTAPSCTVSGLHTNAGTYPIVCSSGTDDNYAFSYVNGTLSIGLVSQTITITIPAPATALFPGSSFTVAATASSGLPVTYSASGACTNVGATFSMNANAPGICTVLYDQAGNSNYAPAPQLSETANIALVIITNGINSHADTGDGHVDELEVTSAGITHLTVTYNKTANNPAGDTDIDDVTNPANYMLAADNGDGIQTSACDVGVMGGDLIIPVNTVTYNDNGGSGPFVATLNLNGGIALPIGNYRLIVCGTTSVVDLASIPLAGNGLASGTDFIRNFSVTNAPPNTAARIPATGFPQNKITVLPSHPADKAYAATDLWVEIPKLGVKLSIVGVPQTKDGWDVTWLDKNAGWLNGSAFPTWQGNSVITAHVWDALNKPGPFTNLKNLKYGDQIKIHAFGQVFTYELRASALISPTNTSAMLKHEEKSWLTLITCEDYKELTQKYSYRRMVRAVLVSVTTEK